MICPSCGSDNPEHAKFCRKCGSPLTAAATTPTQISCVQCGAVLAPEQKFCDHCGQPVAAKVTPTPPPVAAKVTPTPPPVAAKVTSDGSHRGFYLVFALVAFVAIGATLFVLLRPEPEDASGAIAPASSSAVSSAAPVPAATPAPASSAASAPASSAAPAAPKDAGARLSADFVISPRWDMADAFSEHDVARVQLDGKWGLIDRDGNYLCRPQYDQLGYFDEGFAIVVVNGKCGFINLMGDEVIPAQYDNALSFSDGLAAVMKNQKYGFVDTRGILAVDLIYDNARPFAEGVAPVQAGNSWHYLDRSTLRPVFSYPADELFAFSEGLARFKQDGKWGFFNRDFTVAISPRYDEASAFTESGTAIVKEDGEAFLIDANGSERGTRWSNIWSFSDGLATVLNGDNYGYINESGDEVIPAVYSDVYSFAEGLCPVQASPDLGWVYIDRNGDVILHEDSNNGWDEAFKFVNGYARVRNGERFGLIDVNGTAVVPVAQEDVGLYGMGLVPVKENGKWGYYALSED